MTLGKCKTGERNGGGQVTAFSEDPPSPRHLLNSCFSGASPNARSCLPGSHGQTDDSWCQKTEPDNIVMGVGAAMGALGPTGAPGGVLGKSPGGTAFQLSLGVQLRQKTEGGMERCPGLRE